MKRSYEYSFFAIGALFLSILLGASFGLSAQGKGHGGDHGGGPPPGRGGGSPQQAQRQQQPQAQRQEQRQQPQQQRQEQPRYERAPVQRQQPPQGNPGWQNRAGQNQGRVLVEQPRQQQPRFERAPVQRQQQQANPDWQNRGRQNNQGRIRVEQARPQQQPQYRIERRPDLDRGQSQPQYNADRGQGNGRWRQDQRRDDRGSAYTPQTWRSAPGNHAWPNNYGYQRSNEVHTRNADRQAMRSQESFWREQARVSGRSFDGQNFRRDYDRRVEWRDSTLRNVISNVFVGNSDNYYYSQQYDSYNYGYGSQYDPYYYNNGDYWNGYPQYQTYYSTPYSFGYQPYGYQPYGYQPYYYDYSYSNSPYYGGGYPYYSDFYANDFPLVYVTNSYGSYGSYGRRGFLSRLFGQLLASGYDDGYQRGLYARSNGYGDRYYYDPYVYQDTSHDPYPYSYSVGENRRCLSEGYQLGYQDALYGNSQYDPYARGGNADLVSLLIGGVLNRG